MTKAEQFAKFYNDNIDFLQDIPCPFTAFNQGATCCGDKHPTFYGQIIKSPQWEAWTKESDRRFHEYAINEEKPFVDAPFFDYDEAVLLGSISEAHLQEFFKFIKEQYVNG